VLTGYRWTWPERIREAAARDNGLFVPRSARALPISEKSQLGPEVRPDDNEADYNRADSRDEDGSGSNILGFARERVELR
jgi:hypothetical protein